MREIVEFGTNIALLRIAKGLTQEQASERFLLSTRHLQNIEYGCMKVTAETLGRIARTSGIAPATLGIFSWTDEEILALLHDSPYPSNYTGETLDMFHNIALLRKTYGWTQLQLSDLSHVSVPTIRTIEHGAANISVSTLIRIASAFDTSPLILAVLTTPLSELLNAVHYARTVAQIPVSA